MLGHLPAGHQVGLQRRDDDRVHDGVVAPEPVVLADLAHQLVRLHVVPPAQLRAQAELLPDAEGQRLVPDAHARAGRHCGVERRCARKQEVLETSLVSFVATLVLEIPDPDQRVLVHRDLLLHVVVVHRCRRHHRLSLH